MLTLAQQELASAWNDVAAWAIHVLAREGLEGVAVAPLARFPVAAQWIIRRESRESDPRRRQLAAVLAGALASSVRADAPITRDADALDPDLLSELFELEARRVLEASRLREHDLPGSSGELRQPVSTDTPHAAHESASVVSTLIDAAAHWGDRRPLRSRAVEVLTRILETAVAGEPWTNLERAAMALTRHAPRESRELLGRLHRVLLAGHDPGAAIVASLLTGETDLIDDDDRVRRDAQRAAGEYHPAGEARDLLERVTEAAREFESGWRS